MPTLNDIMEFDHPVRVLADGTVTSAHGEYAPEVHDVSDPRNPRISDGWSLLNGYTGQWNYPGPIMHPSEFIGGRLERDIRAEPGVYVAIVIEGPDDDEPIGWAVARKDA